MERVDSEHCHLLHTGSPEEIPYVIDRVASRPSADAQKDMAGDSLADHYNKPCLLKQERFNLLRNTFITNSTAHMARPEIPALLFRYLGCLAVPIIPKDALQRWPGARAEFDLDLWRQDVLEQCLAIANLRRSRRDLLMYLLIHMANYEFTSVRPNPVEDVASWYGLYICGRNYQQPREKYIMETLIKRTEQICIEFRIAREMPGHVRDVLTRRLESEKRRAEAELEKRKAEAEAEGEADARRKQEARENRSLFARATSKVKRILD